MIHKLLAGKGRMKKVVSLLLCLALLGSCVISTNVSAAEVDTDATVEAETTAETDNVRVEGEAVNVDEESTTEVVNESTDETNVTVAEETATSGEETTDVVEETAVEVTVEEATETAVETSGNAGISTTSLDDGISLTADGHGGGGGSSSPSSSTTYNTYYVTVAAGSTASETDWLNNTSGSFAYTTGSSSVAYYSTNTGSLVITGVSAGVVILTQTITSTSGNSTTTTYNTYIITVTDSSSSGSSGTTTTVEPSYRKYVSDNNNDTYGLTLTVSGDIGSSTEPAKVDIIYILDISGSMSYSMDGDDDESNERLTAATDAIKYLTNALNENTSIDARYALVTFSGANSNNSQSTYGRNELPYDDAAVEQTWTSNASTLEASLPTSATGGTNYEAGLLLASYLLQSAREDAVTIVVFLTDGEPTYRYDSNGITAGQGSSYDSDNLTNAGTVLSKMNMNYFFIVGVGSNYGKYLDETYEEITWGLGGQTTETKYGLKYYSKATDGTELYDGSSTDNLSNAFKDIEATVTSLAISNVTVVDTLSANVQQVADTDLVITVTDADGTVYTGNGSLTLAATTLNTSGATLTATIDNEGNIKLEFPPTYQLEAGWTYAVTVTIEATDTAYQNYAGNSFSYPNTGDNDTDAPSVAEGSYISSGKGGVYTNVADSAKLTYTYNETDYTKYYPMPVIPLKPESLVITKTVSGLENDSEALAYLVNNLTFTYTINGKSYDISLSEFTDNQDGTYSYTVESVWPYSTYSVSEDTADILSSYGYVLVTSGQNASDTSEESGTVARGTASTASFTNVYEPADQTLTVTKTVTGNMGDKTKDFTFTLTLLMNGETPYTDRLDIVNAEGNVIDSLEYKETIQAYEFTLSDSESIIIKVPYGYTYTIKEGDSVYTTYIDESTTPSTEATGTIGTVPVTVAYRNHYNVEPDTGINLDSAPYILMLAGVAVLGGVVLFRRRKRLL